MDYSKLSAKELREELERRDKDAKSTMYVALSKQLIKLSEQLNKLKIDITKEEDSDKLDLLLKISDKAERFAKGLTALQGKENESEITQTFRAENYLKNG